MKKFLKILQLFVIAILVYYLFLEINIDAFAKKFDQNFLIAILIAQIPSIIGLFFITYRYLYFIDDGKVKFFVAMKAIIVGTGLNYILPGRVSELLKATYVRENLNLSLALGLGAVFLERLTDMIVVMIFAFLGIIFFALQVNLYFAVAIVALLSIFIVSIIYFEKQIFFLIEKLIKWERLRDLVSNTLLHIKRQSNKKKLLVGVLLGIVIWSSSALTIGVFMNIAGDIHFGIVATFVLLIAGSLGLAVPALPGGLGTFEAASVAVMMRFGYDFDTALALTIGLRLTNMFFFLPAALVISVKNGTGFSKILGELKKG